MADFNAVIEPPIDPKPAPPVPPAPSKWDHFKINATAIGLLISLAGAAFVYWHQAPEVAPTPLPPTPGIVIKAPVGKMTLIKLPALEPGSQIWWNNPCPDKLQDARYLDHIQICPQVTGRLDLSVTAFSKGQWAIVSWIIDAGTGPLPPPDPEPVDPVDPVKPKPKPPAPVLSFRAILVYESGQTLTGPQNSVLYGKSVEDFLTATCTGGKAGWRRRDKDLPGDNDPAMAAFWLSAQKEFASSKNTKTPAVAVQVNDKIEIVPVAATPAEMIATLTKYSKGG